MNRILITGSLVAFIVALGGLFFYRGANRIVILNPAPERPAIDVGALAQEKINEILSAPEPIAVKTANSDIEAQTPLANPPKEIKAIYATGWSAGSEKKIAYLIDLINTTELNALVIDIKDYSGAILYNTDLTIAREYNSVEVRVSKINSLIKRLHDNNIYAIARLAVFQDPKLALARPDLALVSSTTQSTWKDKSGLAWIDPAAREAWDYNIAIARDALARGFDEINFDYIRFPSDGNLKDIIYPHWDGRTPFQKVIKDFFSYLRSELDGEVISADLFGLVTVNKDDLGIGQYLESALPYFDYIAPMVYPSHYRSGFIGFQNPAQYPYEVIKYSLTQALTRMNAYHKNYVNSSIATTSPEYAPALENYRFGKLRPWLQDFDLSAIYTADLVKKQVQAVYDSATTTAGENFVQGWMLWDPANNYTREALELATSD